MKRFLLNLVRWKRRPPAVEESPGAAPEKSAQDKQRLLGRWRSRLRRLWRALGVADSRGRSAKGLGAEIEQFIGSGEAAERVQVNEERRSGSTAVYSIAPVGETDSEGGDDGLGTLPEKLVVEAEAICAQGREAVLDVMMGLGKNSPQVSGVACLRASGFAGEEENGEVLVQIIDNG